MVLKKKKGMFNDLSEVTFVVYIPWKRTKMSLAIVTLRNGSLSQQVGTMDSRGYTPVLLGILLNLFLGLPISHGALHLVGLSKFG